MITYRGKENPWENRISNIAGYCAFGVASFPTQFSGFRPGADAPNQYVCLTPAVIKFWGNMHFAFAGVLFGCFIIFCLVFFQKPDEPYTGHDEQLFKRRKTVYKICGCGIAVSIAMIVLFNIIGNTQGIFAYTTFIFETISLWFFGTAWLIKGSAIWKNVPVLKTLIAPLR